MDLNDGPEQARYRAEVRSWLSRHAAEAPSTAPVAGDADIAARRAWQCKLADAGYVGVTWPTEYGGQGRGALDQMVVSQELARAAAPGIFDSVGIGMVGPTIITFGSDAQRRRYLKPLLRAEEMACQLFSEPAAGSDLAAVELSATRLEGGGWRLRGQKVWSSAAHLATFAMVLARTDPNVPKHAGLSMFLVPMDAQGVTVRALKQISGEADFNEVFIEDVVVADDAILDEPGGGWSVAMGTLLFERLALVLSAEVSGASLPGLIAGLREYNGVEDAAILERAGEVAADILGVRFLSYRMLDAIQRGSGPGLEAGLAKMTSVSASARAAELVVDLAGLAGFEDGEWTRLVSWVPGLRAGGGTDEILRTAIGDRVLGLPREPRADKELPFRASREATEGEA